MKKRQMKIVGKNILKVNEVGGNKLNKFVWKDDNKRQEVVESHDLLHPQRLGDKSFGKSQFHSSGKLLTYTVFQNLSTLSI